MKIAVGCDHRGFSHKEHVKRFLQRMGIEVVDFGTHSTDAVDYPDYGRMVGEAVARGEVDFGIAVCGSGNGVNIAANKVRGVRSAVAFTPEMAAMARRHNNANVLALSGDFTPDGEIEEIVTAFLEAEFEGGRHSRRVAKFES